MKAAKKSLLYEYFINLLMYNAEHALGTKI